MPRDLSTRTRTRSTDATRSGGSSSGGGRRARTRTRTLSTHASSCDESKCVSKGRGDSDNPPNDFDSPFTCYGDDGTFFPMMCADGFLPVVVEDERPMGLSLSYFTCCPPFHLSSEEGRTFDKPARHCSDAITVPIGLEVGDGDTQPASDSIDGLCSDQDTRIYPRPIKSSAHESEAMSYLCCDSISTLDNKEHQHQHEINTTLPVNFLDNVECVPYRNEFYQPARIENQIGKLDVISCDVPEGDFWYARPIASDAGSTTTTSKDSSFADATRLVSTTRRYQCCKTGPSMPPFVQDSAFQITVYPTLALFCIAAILSALVAIGLLIPLLLQLLNGSHQSARHSERVQFRFSIFRSSRLDDTSHHQSQWSLGGRDRSGRSNCRPRMDRSTRSNRSIGSHQSRQRDRSIGSRTRPKRGKPLYSTYNLYLVYLALLDLIYATYMVWLQSSYIHQTFDPSLYTTLVVSKSNIPYGISFRDDPIMIPYMSANMWINAIIAYEVLILLGTSHRRRRIKQPSLTRVNLQAGGVCLFHAILACVFYYVYEPAWEARNHGDVEQLLNLNATLGPVMLVLMMSLPLAYVFWCTAVIWCRGYIPRVKGATTRNRAMRELALYFFRIVAVFLGVWIPGFCLLTHAIQSGQKWAVLAAQCILAFQPTLTTGLILTKSDCKLYIRDLITLSYCHCICFASYDDLVMIEEMEINTGEPKTSSSRENTKISSRMGTASAAHASGVDDRDDDVLPEVENTDDDDDEADSLVFSVLGFRLADAKPRANTGAAVDDDEEEAATGVDDDEEEEAATEFSLPVTKEAEGTK